MRGWPRHDSIRKILGPAVETGEGALNVQEKIIIGRSGNVREDVDGQKEGIRRLKQPYNVQTA